MKSFHGRGMARGYERGRAHIRELNRRNAEEKLFFVGKWSADNAKAEVLFGPMSLGMANVLAEQKNNDEGYPLDWRPYRAAVEHVMEKYDPEGVARLKANPKV